MVYRELIRPGCKLAATVAIPRLQILQKIPLVRLASDLQAHEPHLGHYGTGKTSPPCYQTTLGGPEMGADRLSPRARSALERRLGIADRPSSVAAISLDWF